MHTQECQKKRIQVSFIHILPTYKHDILKTLKTNPQASNRDHEKQMNKQKTLKPGYWCCL